MRTLTLSSFVKILKYAFLPPNGQDAVFSSLFGKLTEYTNGDVDISSKKVSNIMNGKEGLQQELQSVINKEDVLKKVEEIFENDIILNLNPSLLDNMMYKYSELVKNDNSISPKKKEALLQTIDSSNIPYALKELFVYAVSIPFEKPAKSVRIHYRSSAVNSSEVSDILSDFKEQFGSYVDLDKAKTVAKLENDKIYKLTIDCKLSSLMIRGNYFTMLEFSYNNVKYEAQTSTGNWLSESYMNNLLGAGKANLSIIFNVLNTDNGTVHIYIIGEL